MPETTVRRRVTCRPFTRLPWLGLPRALCSRNVAFGDQGSVDCTEDPHIAQHRESLNYMLRLSFRYHLTDELLQRRNPLRWMAGWRW